MQLHSKSILITGGTGSLGRALIKRLLDQDHRPRKLIVLSRDELKQWELIRNYPPDKYPELRCFLGDVRDRTRLIRAFEDVDYVIHAAALKQVPAAEYNPFEFVLTNVIGAQNIVEACLDSHVQKVIALSTDKACAPINLYGATKLCSDKLFIAANNISGQRNVSFSVVRYGNVMGSRGSVIPLFLDLVRSGCSKLPITHPDMTRFNITLGQAVDMVLWSLNNAIGSEIFVPKIPSYNIIDLAEAIAPGLPIELVGLRPGEKIHEEMISKSDSHTTVDLRKYYAILPPDSKNISRYTPDEQIQSLRPGYSYNSGDNETFLTVPELRELVEKHVDSSFVPKKI